MPSPAAAVPGLRREDAAPPALPRLRTGVPAFLGYALGGPVDEPVELARWADFGVRFGGAPADGYLAAAVAAFFRNGGERCVVVRLAEADTDGVPSAWVALGRALDALRPLETVDLVCAPDLARGVAAATAEDRGRARDAAAALQQRVLEHCDRAGDRMALLDALPGTAEEVLAQRAGLRGTNGALYYPWLLTEAGAWVPPCGHVAGVYARGDAREGVHRAPANERLEGVLDVAAAVDDAGQAKLDPAGVNCIRAFPGRGVRVWGARTLSDEAAWRHVGVRRVFLTLGRWIALNLAAVAFEPGTPVLWARIGREVGAYLAELARRGALRGRSAADAFYVRCDGSNNPPEVREAGIVVTEIGLAPAVPGEFVVVRFTHGPGGVDLAGPAPAA
jgi:uncharacterized protein